MKAILILALLAIVFAVSIVTTSVYVFTNLWNRQIPSDYYQIKLDDNSSILVSTREDSPKVWVNLSSTKSDDDLAYQNLTEQMNYHYPSYNWEDLMHNSYITNTLDQETNLGVLYMCLPCKKDIGKMTFQGIVRRFPFEVESSQIDYEKYTLSAFAHEFSNTKDTDFVIYSTKNGMIGMLLTKYSQGIQSMFIYPHKETRQIYVVTGVMYEDVLNNSSVLNEVVKVLTSLTFSDEIYNDALYEHIDISKWHTKMSVNDA